MWLIVVFAFFTSPAISQVPPRPAWAKEALGYGELERGFGDSDLARTSWRRGLSACGTKKQIFILDPKLGRLEEFDSRGRKQGDTVVRNFPANLEGLPPWGGMACEPSGELFAFWEKNRLVLFNRTEVLKDFRVEAMALTHLAFHGNGLIAAMVPLVFRQDTRSFGPSESVLLELGLDGEENKRWLAPATEDTGFAAGLGEELLLAPGDQGSLWVVRQHKTYEVRLFGRDRRVLWSWKQDRSFPVEEGKKYISEETKKLLVPEAQTKVQGLNVPFITRDAAFADGYLWVLLDPSFTGEPNTIAVDIFASTQDRPLARVVLHPRQSLRFNRLVVSKHALWLFPANDGLPEGFFRIPDEVLQKAQEAADGAKGRP